MNDMAPPPTGSLLVDRGLISSDQLRIALLEQKNSDKPLGELLLQLGFINESTLRDALGAALGRRAVDLENTPADTAALQLAPMELAQRCRMLPLAWDEQERRLTIACADPDDIVALDRLRAHIGAAVEIDALYASEAAIARAIDRNYSGELHIDDILAAVESGGPVDGDSQAVIRLIDAIIADAVKRSASDVHFEPEASLLRIRYRIDGVLRQVLALHKSSRAAITVRLKVLAAMDVAEARTAQDGRFSVRANGRDIDVRCSVLPTLHGENIVLRILDRSRGVAPLEQLGLPAAQVEQLQRLVSRPAGVILVTGPTGSGKTTTLYALLNRISHSGINIMTLEDPVEHPLPLLRQTSINESAKLDFAVGVRALLRQDPDIMLVGEIRDADTAAMAFRAAMSGRQVYSTLHCNSALDAVARLLELGAAAESIAGNIIAVIAQRLVRRLCPHCRDSGASCRYCDNQGYRGRCAVMEILAFDEELDELLLQRASRREIRTAAAAKGFRSLAACGLDLVAEGVTSQRELGRVVAVDHVCGG